MLNLNSRSGLGVCVNARCVLALAVPAARHGARTVPVAACVSPAKLKRRQRSTATVHRLSTAYQRRNYFSASIAIGWLTGCYHHRLRWFILSFPHHRWRLGRWLQIWLQASGRGRHGRMVQPQTGSMTAASECRRCGCRPRNEHGPPASASQQHGRRHATGREEPASL